MKLNRLSFAILIVALPITNSFAAALERSNQSVAAFLEPGNYIEAGFNVTDQNISGKTTNNIVGVIANTAKNYNLGEVGDTYLTPKVAAKIQINDQFSVGLLYDEPFGIHTNYTDSTRYLGNQINQTEVEIQSKNISLLFGYQPTENWKIFAGPAYQQLEGSTLLIGQHNAFQFTTTSPAYKSTFKDNNAYGWLGGVSYQNPEQSLKTSLTYRSKIKHKFNANEPSESRMLGGSLDAQYLAAYNNAILQQGTLTTPQSINFEISNAFTTNTIGALQLRWVDWSQVELQLPYYKARTQLSTRENLYKVGGYNPIAYKKDQWSIDLGITQKLSDKWQVNGSLGWDSGVGEYISHYTPINGSWSAGLGVQYSPASNYFVQTGFKYIWLDDVKGQHAKQVALNSNQYDTEFKDNYALSYDFKIGYRF